MATGGIPTVPGTIPDWNTLIQLLESGETVTFYPQGAGGQGVTITTVQELLEYAKSLGYEPVYTVREVLTGFAQVSPADSTTTTDVVVRVGTQIATDAVTGVVSEFISGGHVTFGLVTRQVATSAAMTLLISAIQAGQVPAQVQEDLITAADPFTIDGEHVVILIDDEGKVHYQKELLEAIRVKAVELGVFSNGGITPPSSMEGNYTFVINRGSSTYSGTVTPSQYAAQVPHFVTLDYYRNDNRNTIYAEFNGTKVPLTNLLGYAYSYQNDTQATIGFYFPLEMFQNYAAGTTVSYTLYEGDTPIGGGGVTVYEITFTYNGVSKSIKYPSPIYTQGGTKTSMTAIYGDIFTPLSNAVDIGTSLLYALLYGEQVPSVDGITPNPSTASDMTNLSKPLTEIIPQLAQGEMSTAAPTDDDLENELKWYPVDTTKNNIFDEGTDESETDPDVSTDGDVSPDNKDEIEDLLKDLLKHILDTANDPDSPDYDPTIPDYPVIPVEDNGDTPPEDPPLTPPSDTNGSNGLWSIYNPSLQQVNDFGAWLWSDTLADQFKRIFNSPIDGVIGFHMLYCIPTTGSSKTIKCGFLSSPVSAPVVSSPYVDIDCGTVSIEEFYGNALDYDNTRITIYLPFVGIVPLDTNVVMGSQLNVTYRVDVLTGTCLAQIKVIKQNSNAVMYSFTGNCAVQVPLTATTYTGVVGALLNGISAGASIMTGNLVQAAGSAAGALASGFSGLSGAKQSGTFGANAGALGIRIPYVIITHPVTAMPYNFEALQGLPSNSSVRLSSLSGFTRVKYVHLENIGNATDEEISMIKELLTEGVII